MGCESKKGLFVNFITKLAYENSIERIALSFWDLAVKIEDGNDFLFYILFRALVSKACLGIRSMVGFGPYRQLLTKFSAHVVVKYEPTEDPKHPVI